MHRYNSIQEMPKELRDELEEKETFKGLTDSLFLTKDYSQLIEVAQKKLSNKRFWSIAQGNLIAAYYFKGDKRMSDSLFKNTINHYVDYMSATNFMINGAAIGLIKYMEVPANKKKVMDFAINKYKNDSFKEQEIGVQLMQFYIQDQWIRRNSWSHFKNTNTSEEQFIQENKEQQTELFQFYKKTDKLFSKEEVGEIYDYQLLLLAHVADLKQRKFYFILLKNAISNNVFSKKAELDFILRTEYIQKGSLEFFKTLEVREKELRKEYNLPNYNMSIF